MIKEQKLKVIEKIDAFMDIWKENVKKHYLRVFKIVDELREKLKHRDKYFRERSVYSNMSIFSRLKRDSDYVAEFSKKLNYPELQKDINNYVKDENLYAKLVSETIVYKNRLKNYVDRNIFLDEFLTEQAEIRKNTFIHNIEKLGGDILRLLDLDIDNNSLLNGTVSCVKGDVRIQTISAGGYNIQCYHYRVRQNLLKKRVNPYIEQDLKEYGELPASQKIQEKTANQKKQDIIFKTIQDKIDKMEDKKFIENESRGMVYYNRLKEYGYDEVVKEYPTLPTKPYPTYILPYNNEKKIYWSMGMAHSVDETLDFDNKNLINLFWNLDSTDSIDRVVNTYMKRTESKDIFKDLEPIFHKKKKINKYGYVEEVTQSKTAEVSEHPDHDKYVKLYENQSPALAYLNDMAYDLDIEDEGKPTKIWNRMKEANIDKYLLDLGFKELMKTAYYPIFYKIEDGIYTVITPVLRFIADNKERFDNIVWNTEYMVCKNGGYKLKDVELLAKKYKEDKSYAIMYDCMNLRKKLTPYESPKQSENNSVDDLIKKVIYKHIQREVTNHIYLTRSMKIVDKMSKLNCYKLFENEYKAKKVVLKNKIPIIFYKKEPKSDVYVIVTPQQFIEYDITKNMVIRVFNMMDNSVKADDILHYAKTSKNLGLLTFAVSNDLRKKSQPYIPK